MRARFSNKSITSDTLVELADKIETDKRDFKAANRKCSKTSESSSDESISSGQIEKKISTASSKSSEVCSHKTRKRNIEEIEEIETNVISTESKH